MSFDGDGVDQRGRLCGWSRCWSRRDHGVFQGDDVVSSRPFLIWQRDESVHLLRYLSCRGFDSKYQYMEVSLQTRRKGIESKIPDIAETLKVVKFLEARRVGPTVIIWKTIPHGIILTTFPHLRSANVWERNLRSSQRTRTNQTTKSRTTTMTSQTNRNPRPKMISSRKPTSWKLRTNNSRAARSPVKRL